MDSWLPVIFGFVGVLTGSLFSLWLTKLQLNNADKRFEGELAKAREDSQHQRKWIVRSVPLLKLRDELAVMATKLEKLAKRGNAFTILKTKEQTEEALKQAIHDWESYIAEDHLEIVLYSQFDADVVNRVREIRNEYLTTHYVLVTDEKGLSAVEFSKYASAAEEKIRPKVRDVQELINKRLEEL